MRELMVRDAIREALDEEMARDNTVFQMGEDIGVIGGNFKCTVGLRDKYGDLRVKDTPISEQGFVGMGVGAALTGLRPVVELMFADFMMVCGDQLFNQMAKITYMSGGQCNVPMVVRLPLGGGRSSAAQHFHPCLGRPHPRRQGGGPLHRRRVQGAAQDRHPGQRPRYVL